MRYFLENEILKAEIDSFGAELKSVIRKDNNREYLWYGNPKVWGRTSPVLFPIVGTLRNKSYTYLGKSYIMESHGFARDYEHTFVCESDNEIWFEFKENAETLTKYPFSFVLKIGYRLEGDKVTVMWKVENPADTDLYFSIGAHPAFLCPIHGEKNKEGYTLYFQGASEIKHHGNRRGVAVHEDLTLSLENERARITEDFFDRSTYMIEDKQTGMVAVEDPNGTRFLEVSFDTPLFAIWSPEKKNAPFFCIEPWYGRSDWEDFEGEYNQRDYIQRLAGKELFEASYSMRFMHV